MMQMSGLDEAAAKATATGAQIQAALDVKATPTVDLSNINFALDAARQLLTVLQQAGSAASGAGSLIGRQLRAAYSD